MKNSLVLLVALFLSSCASIPPEQKAAMQALANRPVVCKKGVDCDEKWSKATQWVKQNCSYKFQTVSDNVIQTMGPLPNDPSPAFTITKVSSGNGLYAFDFDGGCDNMFGCIPSVLQSKISFINYIMGPATAIQTSLAPQQASPLKLGIHMIALDPKAIAAPNLSEEQRTHAPDHGVVIVSVDEDSPAAHAGIKPSDVITKVNGKPTISTDDLKEAFLTTPKGKSIPVVLFRGGEERTLEVKL
jgi:hypothetical protein